MISLLLNLIFVLYLHGHCFIVNASYTVSKCIPFFSLKVKLISV